MNNYKEEEPLVSIPFDFSIKPDKLEPWNLGQSVNRANFTSFLTTSYAVGQGYNIAQLYFIMYVGFQTGIDMLPLFRNFNELGSFDNLSTEEQELFLETFDKVMLHHHTPLGEEGTTTRENIIDDLGGIAGWLDETELPESLKKMDRSELMVFLNETVSKRRESPEYQESEAGQARSAFRQKE